jgi:L-amino acid N-acyltransferase
LSGYRFTVSGSIYVKPGRRGAGVGRALSKCLLSAARERGYHCILAGVNSENRASIALLESFGFERVGHFREIGQKNGRWHDDVCLQKIL